jgi:hypothetical protein
VSRPQFDHNIEKETVARLNLAGVLGKDEKLTKADWSLDHSYGNLTLKAKLTPAGRKAVLRFKGGSPGCQHVLRLDGKTSKGNPVELEYLVNTFRDSSQDHIFTTAPIMTVRTK